MRTFINLFILILFCFSCSETSTPNEDVKNTKEEPAAISLFGKELFPMKESPTSLAKKDSLLAIAKKNFDLQTDNLENIIWYGRRLAYLSRYQEAIAIYTKGMDQFPDAAELYRHRGHRYISIRKFDQAIADFKKAAALAKDRAIEIEPDGMPNKLNIPLSSLQFNIWYHLGLAYYLKGDFAQAEEAYLECMKVSTNPDLLTATSDWLYMTYRRLNKIEKANKLLENIDNDLELIENTSYHKRLLMYKGLKQANELLDFQNKKEDSKLDIVTQGYGVGNWYLYNGDEKKAKEIYNAVLESDYWSAFGYIAAEADLYLLNKNN